MKSLQKLTGILLLATYGFLAVGGSGLHHAPLFGLHCCSSDSTHQGDSADRVNDPCGCGHHHVGVNELGLGQTLGSQESQNCHAHDCQFCDFYSITYTEIQTDKLPAPVPSCEQVLSALSSTPNHEVEFIRVRGPPQRNC